MHTTPHTEESKSKMSVARRGKPIPAGRRPSIVVDGEERFRCPTCEQFLPRDGFYKTKRTLFGVSSQCRKCHMRTSQKSRNHESACQLRRESMRRQRANDPEKFRARDRARSVARVHNDKTRARASLNAAVRCGQVQRPATCSRCGKLGRVTGHHDDYSKPLVVTWLCYECHGREHRKPISFRHVAP